MAALCVLGAVTAACSAQLPKAPPPPSTSHGVTTTTATTTTTTVTNSSGRAGAPTSPVAGRAPGTAGGAGTASSSTASSSTGTPARAGTTSAPRGTGTPQGSQGVASSSGAPSAPAASTVPATTTPPPPTTATVPYNTDAVASAAVGPAPVNWNLHSALASGSVQVLRQVLAQVWPSAFDQATNGAMVMNSALLQSATEVSTRPQRVVYKINPRAVWSDGQPITYRDFQYNWQAQSGRLRFHDVGGQPYLAADTLGYHKVASVSGAPGDPYTVTVSFLTPDPDWRSLFSYLVPAHVAQKVGFNRGFTAPVDDLVSGGPYVVTGWQPGYALQLVRNPHYWATPANLAALNLYFTSSSAEVLNSVVAGELDVASLGATPQFYQQLSATSGPTVTPVASSWYEDLDFNETGGLLSSLVLRRAVMTALDRAGLADQVLGPYGLAPSPVENRAYLPGTPGYVADGSAYDLTGKAATTAAARMLSAAGYRSSGGQLRTPAGRPVALTLYVPAPPPVPPGTGAVGGQAAAVTTAGGPQAAATALLAAQAVRAACSALGIAVTLDYGTTVPGDHPGSGTAVAPPAGWEMALVLRRLGGSPWDLFARYHTGGLGNLDHYSSPAMDRLLAGLSTASQPAGPLDQVDAMAWSEAVDLPLVQVPYLVVVSHKLLNVDPGPLVGNLGWDAEDWGFAAP